MRKVGVIKGDTDFILHVFIATQWEGNPKPAEKEIIDLHWFESTAIPYTEMWPDNIFWLPLVFEDKLITAHVLKNVYQDEELTKEDVIVQQHQVLPE